MDSIPYLLAALLYVLLAVPTLSWIVTCVTILHTVDEIKSGPIWEVLHVPAIGYVAFQLGVLIVGLYATTHQADLLCWSFVAVRLGDFLFTHVILRAPGTLTAPLLVIDASLVAMQLIVSLAT